MSKQSFYCPYDNETKIIRVPDETDMLFTQVLNDYPQTSVGAGDNGAAKPRNPSKIFKFVHCKTSEPSKHASAKKFQNKNLFYKAKDVWEFSNVGVSKPPPNIKDAEFIKVKSLDGDVHNYAVVRYLVCGHCDRGAFGFGGYLVDLDEMNNRVEIGFDLTSVNPNDLVYFFYV